MFRLLLLLITVIFVIEIGILLWVGSHIGAGWTFALMVITGIFGVWFARKQGAQVLQLAQIQLRNRDVPSDAILDGICVLTGAIFLITPGFITDLVGLILLLPYTRVMIKVLLQRWIKQLIQNGKIGIFINRPF